ncbi:MAG: FAD-binding oxidoreductase [Limnobacter sp.]|nr:FAD-binding oxidoreductase [Limnobacter sp.]
MRAVRDLLSASEWLEDPQEVKNACLDWRKRYQGHALGIAQPKSVQALQQVVRLCNQYSVAISTQGGNTGLVGGAVPVVSAPATPHIVLRTTLLKGEIQIDPANLTLTADAGHTLLEIQQAASKAGYLFPLSLASEGTCTIGGNLASNAGGVAVLRYGNARELCLGLEFVSAQGDLCGDLRGLRKNNTGYDLRHLLIGSEGTLGVITRVCLKIYPTPRATVVAWLNVESLTAAVNILQSVQNVLFSDLSSYEWMNANAIELVQQHFPVQAPGASDLPESDHVLAEFTALCSQDELEDRVQNALAALLEKQEAEPMGLHNVFVAQSLSENEDFWAVRENISEAQAKEGLNVKHDIACAVSKLPDFHKKATQAIQDSGLQVRPILFGHLGDGNLHYNLSAPAGENNKTFLADHQEPLNRIVHTCILEVGGTISAEHGIGQLKAELLKEITDPAHYQLMLSLKKAMDPNQILNPGKLLIQD